MSEAITNDRTSEIAIFARLIKAENGDLSRQLALYPDPRFRRRGSDPDERFGREEPGGCVGRRGAKRASELREGGALARPAPFQGQEIATGEEGILRR